MASPPPKSMTNALVAARQQVLNVTDKATNLEGVNYETALEGNRRPRLRHIKVLRRGVGLLNGSSWDQR